MQILRGRSPERLAPVTRILAVMILGLTVWLFLAAPRLLRAAESSPQGIRRTASLTVLRPIAWLARSTGAATLTGTIERALGRDPDEQPGGELDLDTELAELDLPDIPPDDPTPPRPSPQPTSSPTVGLKSVDEELRVPTERYKLRIAVIGDSFADGVGQSIARATDGALVHVLSLGRIATGLARADYFDWVDGVAKVEARYEPDVIVVMMGGNDKQSVVFPNGRTVLSGDSDWGAAYKERIGDLLGATQPDTHIAWIGLPPVRDRGKSDLFWVYNDMYESVLKSRRNSLYLDIWDRFADGSGRYRAYGRGPGGDTTLLRASDGSHFTAAGYDLVTQALVKEMLDRWELAPRAID